MGFRRIDQLAVRGARVFVRVDFNVPLDEAGAIRDDTRIQAALPTIRELIAAGARVVLASHLGRPKGKVVDALRLRPVAARLGELLGREVQALGDCVGPEVEAAVAELPAGEAVLLENLRFHEEETAGEPEFAAALARLADAYVNDAFGAAHRAHASVVGVPRLLPADRRAAGRLMEKELDAFQGILEHPERPFHAVLGGAKVSDKILVVDSLLDRVDALVIGGGMAYTFLKAQGHAVGASKLEADQLDVARAALAKAAAKGVEVLLPVDHVAAAEFAATAAPVAVDGVDVPEGLMALDIGPQSAARFRDLLARARTVVWNGPLGVFEWDAFAAGTRVVAEALAASDATAWR